MTSVSLSVVIVAHDSLAELRQALPALLAQLSPEDELIVVDNASHDGLESGLTELAPTAQLISSPTNVGFAAGANMGAARATRDVLIFLNPDAIVEPGWAGAMRAAADGPWAGWMALVTLDNGSRINTSGGVLHFTGIGWAGQLEQPITAAPTRPCEVGFLSGASLAIPLATWREIGGFAEEYFMYCEDVDLSLKLRLRGGRIGVVPDARVVHDYAFLTDTRKWRLLERNRWATVLRTYPGTLLALLTPALIATEIAIWVTALRGGWLRMKALATVDVIRAVPRLLAERSAIQRTRSVSARAFAAGMTDELSSPSLGRIGTNPGLAWALRAYWRATLAVLK
jgi:GT2 family glycosyltransferase